eukprot:2597676-Karenia_brevis.AAC.1
MPWDTIPFDNHNLLRQWDTLPFEKTQQCHRAVRSIDADKHQRQACDHNELDHNTEWADHYPGL